MACIKVWVFKESGKWYTEEDFELPSYITEVYQALEYVKSNFVGYKGMHLVIPLTEMENGYPCLILADQRAEVTEKVAASVKAGDFYVVARRYGRECIYTIYNNDYTKYSDGIYDDPELSVEDVVQTVVNELKLPAPDGSRTVVDEDDWIVPHNYEELMLQIESTVYVG